MGPPSSNLNLGAHRRFLAAWPTGHLLRANGKETNCDLLPCTTAAARYVTSQSRDRRFTRYSADGLITGGLAGATRDRPGLVCSERLTYNCHAKAGRSAERVVAEQGGLSQDLQPGVRSAPPPTTPQVAFLCPQQRVACRVLIGAFSFRPVPSAITVHADEAAIKRTASHPHPGHLARKQRDWTLLRLDKPFVGSALTCKLHCPVQVKALPTNATVSSTHCKPWVRDY